MKDFRDLDLSESVSYFTIDKLYVSPLNPRQDANNEGIDLLAESIASIGLIQSLAGHLDDDGRVGIVGGGRRLRAIKVALDRDPDAAVRHPNCCKSPSGLPPMTTWRGHGPAWKTSQGKPSTPQTKFARLLSCGIPARLPQTSPAPSA